MVYIRKQIERIKLLPTDKQRMLVVQSLGINHPVREAKINSLLKDFK